LLFVVILLAEDNIGLRNMLSALLKRKGHTVLATGDGQEALSMARAHAGSIDLLLADVDLPGISGLALCRTLRMERPETNLLLMSGDHRWQHESRLLGVPFLLKPFAPSAILLHLPN
jgi:DNA-binding response OmpR family regulator